MSSGERLQKVLANQGLGSRREIESWIVHGVIQVNGVTAVLGTRVTPDCQLVVKGKLVTLKQAEPQLLMYHKPVGEVCSRKPEAHERSVYESLPEPKTGKWLSIGRLDLNTSGLLLFTNDGELAHQMMHPKFELEREYKVRAFGHWDTDMLEQFHTGISLEDGLASFDVLEHLSSRGDNHWFRVILKEGRNRLVRRMFEAKELQVNRLIRTRFGEWELPEQLQPGSWDMLETKD